MTLDADTRELIVWGCCLVALIWVAICIVTLVCCALIQRNAMRLMVMMDTRVYPPPNPTTPSEPQHQS